MDHVENEHNVLLMRDNDEVLMKKHNITSTMKVIYTYKKYKYENLQDALKFAEIDSNRSVE